MLCLMKYPSKAIKVPSVLTNAQNGKLDPSLLKKVDCGGLMFTDAAKDFNAMYKAAKTDDVTLKTVGHYRTYAQQVALFKARYEERDLGRKPRVTRKWQNSIWFLKPGMSPAGVPGTSNHGLGLAIDLNVQNKATLAWLCEHAPTYNFYLQGSDPKSPEFEAWHWQWTKP